MIGVFNEVEVGGDRQPAESFPMSALLRSGFTSWVLLPKLCCD